MARTFGTTSDYVHIASTPVSNFPVTMACWFYPTSSASNYNMLTISENGASNNMLALTYEPNFFITCEAKTVVAGTSRGADTAINPTLNAWNHMVGVFTAATRTSYLNAGNTGTDSFSIAFPSGLNTVTLGAAEGATVNQPFVGSLAHCAIWNAALTASEVYYLYNGYFPDQIRPGNLVGYWPLSATTPVLDLSRYNRNGTLNGSKLFADPLQMQRSRRLLRPELFAQPVFQTLTFDSRWWEGSFDTEIVSYG